MKKLRNEPEISLFVDKLYVPIYLKGGLLFHSLDNDDTEKFAVPAKFMKMDTYIRNKADMEHLLKSLQYWMVTDVPATLVSFALNQPFKSHIGQLIADSLAAVCTELRDLQHVCNTLPKQRIAVAISLGRVNFVMCLHKRGYLIPPDACTVAAAGGHRGCLEYVHAHGGRLVTDSDTQCQVAAWKGSVKCLEYLHQHGCPLGAATVINATKGNHLPCLQYALEHGGVWNPTAILTAAELGYSECLQCLMTAVLPFEFFTVLPSVQRAAALATHAGHFNCLRLCCEWSPAVPKSSLAFDAARGEHAHCLHYLRDIGCGWGTYLPACAAQLEDLACLRFLHQLGCPWDAETTRMAALHGHLACLQYAHQQGCSMDFDLAEVAALDRLECLQYGVQHGGCRWDAEVYADVLEFGSLRCKDYAARLGCPGGSQPQ